MSINEIISGVFCYQATIRAKRGNSSTTARTILFAYGISQARALLGAMFGGDSVISVKKVSESDLSETVSKRPKPNPESQVLPTEYTHDLAQKALFNHIKLNALHVKPTVHDLKAAKSDFEAEQKRVNREYENKQKWAEIRKRRIKN